jgi:hypothetical protein
VRLRIVENDVQLATGILTRHPLHEAKKMRAGMAISEFAWMTRPVAISGAEQIDNAVALVVVGVAGGTTSPKRRWHLSLLQSLDGRLLVDAEDEGVTKA